LFVLSLNKYNTMSTVTIVRKKEFINIFRNYTIVIDGKKAGKVAWGTSKVFHLPTGEHTIQAGVDWCLTPAMDVRVRENEKKSLLVSGFTNSDLYFKIFIVILLADFILTRTIDFE